MYTHGGVLTKRQKEPWSTGPLVRNYSASSRVTASYTPLSREGHIGPINYFRICNIRTDLYRRQRPWQERPARSLPMSPSDRRILDDFVDMFRLVYKLVLREMQCNATVQWLCRLIAPLQGFVCQASTKCDVALTTTIL